MELRITTSELAQRLADVLGRIRQSGDTYVVESEGEPVVRMTPILSNGTGTVGEALRAWMEDSGDDPSFADDLESVNNADRPPANPWE